MDQEKQTIAPPVEQGSPSAPIHITQNSWDEETNRLEDYIRNNLAFEGKIESYIDSYRLMIPINFRHLFETGGVITFGTERHLMLFGLRHWERYQRLLAKQVGLSPVNNELARHIYSNMYRFTSLNDDGSVNIPYELLDYAGINRNVAIIGLIYHAEIHNKTGYLAQQKPEVTKSRLARFRKIVFN